MNEGFQNLNAQNFDPNTLASQTASVIMFTVVNDESGSITTYQDDMNRISREVFIDELRNCHRKDDIVAKSITFHNTVDHKSGFMPILNIPDDYFDVNGKGMTALYDAVLEALEHSILYREDLEKQGVDVRTCIFIITDGDDNQSDISSPKKIKAIVEDLRKREDWSSSFTINMLGVGQESIFRKACVEMGLNPDKCLSTINSTAKDIRAQFGVISQSVSSSSNASTTVNF